MFDRIEDVQAFQHAFGQPRIRQQHLTPTAVKQRLLGEIISGEPPSTALGSGISTTVTITNATSALISFTTTDPLGRIILSSPDISIYSNSVSEANHWPTGPIGMGNMPIMFFNNWGRTNNVNSVTSVVIRNNTGSDQTVVVVYRARLLVNPVAGSGGSNV